MDKIKVNFNTNYEVNLQIIRWSNWYSIYLLKYIWIRILDKRYVKFFDYFLERSEG